MIGTRNNGEKPEVSNMGPVSPIPHSFTEDILKSFADFLNILRNNVFAIADTLNIPNEARVPILDEVSQALNAVINVENVYKATNVLYKHPLFVEPQSVTLGYRNDVNLRERNDVENIERKEESYYIPVIKTIQAVLSDPVMADLVLNEKDYVVPPGTYTSPKHGSKYQTHPLFSDKLKRPFEFNCRTTEWANKRPPWSLFYTQCRHFLLHNTKFACPL